MRPRTESAIVPEISGRVLWVSPSFVSGGFFEKGEVLLKIDSHDYEQAVVRSRSEVANAKLRLAQEEAEFRVAHDEWDDLGKGEATPLTLREPQLENAKASVAAAEANVITAERNLDRTQIRAPYVGPGSPEERRCRAVCDDWKPHREHLRHRLRRDSPPPSGPGLWPTWTYRSYIAARQGNRKGPKVILRANFAGGLHEWEGRIVRTEGEIDAKSRMVHAVAQVVDPYGRKDPDRPPLAAGLFVEAEIDGQQVEQVVVLPRAALRGESQVLVVDGEDRLRFRDIDPLRVTREEIVVRSGLERGERVCLSPLEAVTDGMKVRTGGGDAPVTEGGRS